MSIFCSFLHLRDRKFAGRIVLSVCACFLLGACQQPIEPVDSLKARVLEANGGADALERISILVYRGKIFTRADSGTVTLILSRPGRLRTTMEYEQRYEDRILLHNKGWRDFGDGFEEASGYSLDAMIFQYNHLDLPMGLLDEKYTISYVDQKGEDHDYPILELVADNEPPMAVIIDPETGLIKQVNGRILIGSNEVVMGVGYRDYRKVHDVMLPSRIINYVNGEAIAESVYNDVQLNMELPPETFNVGQ